MATRWMWALVVGAGLVGFAGTTPARAVIASQTEIAARGNFVEARLYDIVGGRVAEPLSAHQTVTAWQVTSGSWNGQALDGLTLVLVQTTSDDGRAAPLTNCYVSHLATPAQRRALLTAYQATRTDSSPGGDPTLWRVEPAVIRFEILDHNMLLHVGAIG